MTGNAVITTQNLTKTYGSGSTATHALSNLDLEVQRGEIFGYLGPNGAGKTTTIRLLLDLIRPTQGSAQILGMDSREHSIHIHQHVGFLPAELNLWKGRTAKQVVHYLASVRGDVKGITKEANELAEQLKLDMSKKVRDYSTGNKRKLGLVIAMMHKPDLLILDEPTSGLDPLMQQTFNQMMRRVRDQSRTVFLSSHVLSEVQAICDRVGVLRDGELKAIESVERLTHVEFRHVEITLRDAQAAQFTERLAGMSGVEGIGAEGNTLKFQLYGDFDPLLRALSDQYIEDIRTDDPSLEEIFLSFYGGEAEDTTQAVSLKEAI
jgi:ABC-2 type transport system ATP-binding protein